MSDIKIEDITTGVVDGTGVFDKIQTAMAANLVKEYQHGRLKGTDYAEVYVGGMQSAMQQAIAFVLGEQQADKEADLIAAKIVTEGLLQTKLTKETLLVEEQTKLVTAQITKTNAETAVLAKELEVAEAKIWVTKAQVSDDLSITSPPSSLTTSKGVMGRSALKTESEIGLLDQKTVSESAQTDGTIPDTDSVLGKEILLRQRQADGFLRDAEQKLAKIVGDSFAVQFTTLDGLGEGGVLPGAFTAGGISEIINKAKDGVFNP